MMFKVSPQKGMIGTFEQLTGQQAKNGVLTFPEKVGEGNIKIFELGSSLQIMLHQYILKEDLITQRPAGSGKDLITFSFRQALPQQGKTTSINPNTMPCVQVSSGSVDLETFTPANTEINVILIRVQIDLLRDLFNGKEESNLLKNVISGELPYLYDELLSTEIQAIAVKLFESNTTGQLNDFFLKVKAQELIYLFFKDLLKRETVTSYPMNASDVKMMYLIREKLTFDLTNTPNLQELTKVTHMSESKMSRLFKQIFGTSIYNYHQTLRLTQAAHLLRTEKISVSEAGYRLGFTNLSHFSRIFERQFSLKPKKYSAVSTT